MTTHTCATDTCSRPVPDTAFICPTCGDRLRAQLLRVPDEITEPGLVVIPGGRGVRRAIDGGRTIYGIASSLDQVIQRQTHTRPDRADERGPLAISETPLPYNPAASEIRTVLTGTLTFWTAAISEQRGLRVDDWTPAGMATFLASQVDWLRAQAAGADAFDELTAAVRTAERATDRPADRQYAGPCTAPVDLDGVHLGTCGTDLYAWPGRDTITCPTCGTDTPVQERRTWLLEQTDDIVLTVAELERALDVKHNTLKSWIARERLVAHGGTSTTGVARYRVGDVRALMAAAEQRKQRVPA